MTSSKERIGFIGVGVMGGPMAQRLVRAGHHLIVYDIDSRAVQPLTAAGARAARSPKIGRAHV